MKRGRILANQLLHMLKIYLHSGLRSLLRFRGFTFINLVGLSLGFSAIMVMSVMLYQYLTANGQFQNKSRMYYVKLRNADGGSGMQTPYPFLDAALASSPDIVAGTHIQSFYWPWLKAGSKEFQENTWFVDPGFFQVFSFPVAYGDPKTALHNKFDVVLSHEMAEKLFGSAAAAQGKTLTLDDTIGATVAAVLEPVPTNTTIRPQVILTTALLRDDAGFVQGANWYNSFAENYLLLRPGADTARVNRQLAQLSQLKFDPANRSARPYLAPYSKFVQEESGNLTMVLVKGQVGTILFILLLIVANLLNLNAATLLARQKEMAVRKMMGSGRIHIILQFVLENAMVVFAALLLAFGLFRWFLMPAINEILKDQFGTIAVNIRHDYPLVGVFVFAGLVIVVLAGSLPAFHFGSLRAADAIKGRITRHRERHFARNSFITLQFVLATIFIGVSIILRSQIAHMRTAVLGFDKEHVLVVPLDLAYHNPATAAARFDALLNDLRHDPAVEQFSTSWNIPTQYEDNFNTFFDPSTNREVNMRQGATDVGMLPTFHINLAGGQNFDGIHDSLNNNKVIINRRAASMLGWTNAVGRTLRAKGGSELYTVIGVMDDFRYGTSMRDIGPVINSFGGHQGLGYRYLSIRVVPGHDADVLALVQKGFHDMPARRVFSYENLSDRVDHQYAFLEGLVGVTNYVAILTVFIAAMGLFGLVALFTRQRVKEVGIRKVLGAEVFDIVGMLSKSFLLLILLSLLIASPIAWWIMHTWLQDFAYRITIEWWMLLGAGGIALGIGVFTIGWHALRVARSNPVDSLRSE
jgi:putative ABC transport system permease protein